MTVEDDVLEEYYPHAPFTVVKQTLGSIFETHETFYECDRCGVPVRHMFLMTHAYWHYTIEVKR